MHVCANMCVRTHGYVYIHTCVCRGHMHTCVHTCTSVCVPTVRTVRHGGGSRLKSWQSPRAPDPSWAPREAVVPRAEDKEQVTGREPPRAGEGSRHRLVHVHPCTFCREGLCLRVSPMGRSLHVSSCPPGVLLSPGGVLLSGHCPPLRQPGASPCGGTEGQTARTSPGRFPGRRHGVSSLGCPSRGHRSARVAVCTRAMPACPARLPAEVESRLVEPGPGFSPPSAQRPATAHCSAPNCLISWLKRRMDLGFLNGKFSYGNQTLNTR